MESSRRDHVPELRSRSAEVRAGLANVFNGVDDIQTNRASARSPLTALRYLYASVVILYRRRLQRRLDYRPAPLTRTTCEHEHDNTEEICPLDAPQLRQIAHLAAISYIFRRVLHLIRHIHLNTPTPQLATRSAWICNGSRTLAGWVFEC